MPSHLSTGTVLIVEDDEQSLRAIRALLTAYGFKAICAGSGAEALQLLETQHELIQCVLTDLYMPGVSGMDLLMHIRQTLPELPVVVVTGNADVPSATMPSTGELRPQLRAVVDVPLVEARSRFERSYLQQVLEESGGNLSQAARRSGMDRSNFRRLLDRYGVRPGRDESARRVSGA